MLLAPAECLVGFDGQTSSKSEFNARESCNLMRSFNIRRNSTGLEAIVSATGSDSDPRDLPPANPTTYPVQLIIYGPGEPTYIEGTSIPAPDGSFDLQLPIETPPSVGTPVQVIMYGPSTPTVIEGTTGKPGQDGSFDIIPVP